MEDGWDKFYRHVIEEAGRLVNEKLDWFRVSLGDWLYGQLNWPTDDWQQQLDLLVEHTRYYGLIIEPDCVQALHDLVDARVKRTGPFAALAAGVAERAAMGVPIQVAAAVALDDGTRTDATVPLDSGPTPTMKDGREVAGPGPATTASFQKKVHAALAILDVEVAIWWNRAAGEIRSRAASGWTTFLRSNEKYFVEDGKPIVLVDENYTVALTAAAIMRGTARLGPFRDLFDQERIPGPDEATRYAEVQERRFREAAAIAAAIAETYLATLGSLTPAGELIVTVDDVSQHGIRWDHLLILLPALAYLRKHIKLLTIKLPGGRRLRLSGRHLEALQKLNRGERKALIAKAQKAESEAEALAIIKREVGGPRKVPAKGKPPKHRPKVKPKRGPGKWIRVNEGMPDRARRYQMQITGRTGQAYLIGNVKYDGFKDGVLLEAKGPGYLKFVKRPDTLQTWFEGADDLISQARDQVRAASDVRLEWHVAEPEFIVALKKLFHEEGITGIRFVHTPVLR